ncbi:MAG: ATP-binding cassette domain-containing protein [Puia sp.]
MILLQNVIKKFGEIEAVDHLSFEVKEGENVVLLGTSGCGKTTTLRMINRLTEATSGEIFVGGKNIKDIPAEELRRNIGYVLQHNGLFPHYTIAQNIAIVPELLKWPKQKIKSQILELLGQLNLPSSCLDLYPRQLSGGQQQRVGLARALAANPPVLLMDEPFGALDAITRNSISKEFSKLEALKRKTIVLVTHDIREAFEMGDTILLMDRGKIVQSGKSTELLFKPKNKFVTDFFSAQRLQLELNSVLLKDVWRHLPDKDHRIKEVTEFDESKSLWEAIDELKHQNNKVLSVRNASSGEVKVAGYDAIFASLEALKRNDYE